MATRKGLYRLFEDSVRARDPAVRVNTDDIDDAIKTIDSVCDAHGWRLRVWDAQAGVVWYHGKPKQPAGQPALSTSGSLAGLNNAGPGQTNVLGVLQSFLAEPPTVFSPDGKKAEIETTVLVVKNGHLAFERERAAVSSALQHLVGDKVHSHAAYQAKDSTLRQACEHYGIEPDNDTGKVVVTLMPLEAKLPPEVRPLFRVIDHDTPDDEELLVIYDGVVPAGRTADETRHKACQYARGLTRLQVEGVLAAAIATHGKDINARLPQFVWEQKSKIFNDEGLVELYTGSETFADVVGLEGAKRLFRNLVSPSPFAEHIPELRGKGVCVVGPPRVGKSLILKALGNELGIPVLMLNPGALMGGFVGDTERNTRKVFQIIRAHAPCVVVIDEVEKVMPSGREDDSSGVGRRMAGTFMTQMQDIKEAVFWAFSANSIDNLHEAFLADDRVDAVVFVHMPGARQRAACWKMYLKKFHPREVGGEPFPHAMDTDFDAVLEELSGAKKINVGNWANRLVAPLLCVPAGKERVAALQDVADVDANVSSAAHDLLIDDDGWTPARIKSVCRLSSMCGTTLTETARMMPRREGKLAKAVARLEKWAEDEAIDAETGVAYVRPKEDDGAAATQYAPKVKPGASRRKLRDVGE
jgi:hypothetical protein